MKSQRRRKSRRGKSRVTASSNKSKSRRNTRKSNKTEKARLGARHKKAADGDSDYVPEAEAEGSSSESQNSSETASSPGDEDVPPRHSRRSAAKTARRKLRTTRADNETENGVKDSTKVQSSDDSSLPIVTRTCSEQSSKRTRQSATPSRKPKKAEDGNDADENVEDSSVAQESENSSLPIVSRTRSRQTSKKTGNNSKARRKRRTSTKEDEDFVPSSSSSGVDDSEYSHVLSEESYVPSEEDADVEEPEDSENAGRKQRQGEYEEEGWKEMNLLRGKRRLTKKQKKPKAGKTPTHVCSGLDAITMEPLEDQCHYCWQEKQADPQCYSFGTLHRIATAAGNWREPPIFRDMASEKTLQGMKIVFGAKKVDEQDFSADAPVPDARFQEQFARYRYRLLPRAKLYACPLCYECVRGEIEEDRRRTNIDPLVVLGLSEFSDLAEEEDRDECAAYIAAGASLCYKRIGHLIAHMKIYHGITDATRRCYKPIFHRYKFRESDGLVQRYWHKLGDKRRVQSYWRDDSDRVPFFICIHNVLNDSSDAAGSTVDRDKEKCKEIWHELTGAIDANDEEDDSFIVGDDEVSEYSDASEAARKPKSEGEESDASMQETQRMIQHYAKIEEQFYTPKRKRKQAKPVDSSISEQLRLSDGGYSDKGEVLSDGKPELITGSPGSAFVGSESSSEGVKKNAKPNRRLKRPKSRRAVDFSSSESDNEVVETPVGSGNTKSKLIDSDAE